MFKLREESGKWFVWSLGEDSGDKGIEEDRVCCTGIENVGDNRFGVNIVEYGFVKLRELSCVVFDISKMFG